MIPEAPLWYLLLMLVGPIAYAAWIGTLTFRGQMPRWLIALAIAVALHGWSYDGLVIIASYVWETP